MQGEGMTMALAGCAGILVEEPFFNSIRELRVEVEHGS
jgi:hypothetical protein